MDTPPSSEPRTIARMLAVLGEQQLADAVDSLIWNGEQNAATPFERYAARELEAAAASQLRYIDELAQLKVSRFEDGSALVVPSIELAQPERETVYAVESALSRIGVYEHVAHRMDGGEGLVGTLSDTDIADAHAHLFPAWSTLVERMRSRPDLGESDDDGVWHTMLAFCTLVESLHLPLRFDARCDFDPSSGVFGIAFEAPTPAQLPLYDFIGGTDVDGAPSWAANKPHTLAQRASAMTLALAALLALAAFTSGRAVTTVLVHAYDDELTMMERPVASARFARASLTDDVMRAIGEAVGDHIDTADPQQLLRLLAPVADVQAGLGEAGRLVLRDAFEVPEALMQHRIPVWKDNRTFPENLQRRLHALNVRSLDVDHDDGIITAQQLDHTVEENPGNPFSAEMELENAITRIEQTRPKGRKPLYCGEGRSRAAVGMLFDDPDVIYWRAPLSLFRAHMALAYSFMQGEQPQSALEHARRCVELAPLTADAYTTLALVTSNIDVTHQEKALEILCEGLRHATTLHDYSKLYLHLALWHDAVGRAETALACVQRALAGRLYPAETAEATQLFIRLPMMLKMSGPMDQDAARRTLEAAGLDIDSYLETAMFVDPVVRGLADAGMPCAAAMCMEAYDDVMVLMQRSLRDGIAKPAANG